MSKGILGRKVGMTQLFDPDTGKATPGDCDSGRSLPGVAAADRRKGWLLGCSVGFHETRSVRRKSVALVIQSGHAAVSEARWPI